MEGGQVFGAVGLMMLILSNDGVISSVDAAIPKRRTYLPAQTFLDR